MRAGHVVSLSLSLSLLVLGTGCSTASTPTGTDAASGDAATADGGGNETDTGSTAIDAGADAAATQDASGTDSGTCNACTADTIAWSTDGGLVCTRDASEVSACRTYRHRRMAAACDPTDLECTDVLDACDGASSVSIEALLAALADPDVVAALAAAPVLYGSDPRPVDGTVRWFTVGGSARVEVGNDPGIPAGVANLVSLLDAIDAAQLARPSCSAVFGGP